MNFFSLSTWNELDFLELRTLSSESFLKYTLDILALFSMFITFSLPYFYHFSFLCFFISDLLLTMFYYTNLTLTGLSFLNSQLCSNLLIVFISTNFSFLFLNVILLFSSFNSLLTWINLVLLPIRKNCINYFQYWNIVFFF